MSLSSKATAPPTVVSLHSAMEKYHTSQKIVGTNTMRLDDFHATICDSTVSENEKEEQFYDLQCAATYILEWMRHILRAAHTHQTKVQALESLDDRSAYCIGDWMMKIIPQHFREKMEDWFGKRGISGHVTAFIMKEGQYKKATYFTFIDVFKMDTHQRVSLKMSLRSLKMTFHWSIKFTVGMIMQLVIREQQS